jgi:NADH:ubiquinone oxidoreductase subunit
MSVQGTKIPPPWHGWLSYTYDETPNKKNFVEPSWRPSRSFQIRYDHPLTSNFHIAPGSFGNELQQENIEFMKQKTYLEWNPPKTVVPHHVDSLRYDKVKPYDITKEN